MMPVINIVKEKTVNMLHEMGIDVSLSRAVKIDEDSKPLLINLGAGNWQCKGWINLDYSSKWYAKMQRNHKFIEYNLRNDNIPFDVETIDGIYCSHVIEHLEDCYDDIMFSECFRVLKTDGVLRIACPDAEFLWEMTQHGKDWWMWRKNWCRTVGIDWNELKPIDFLVRELATPRMRDYGYLYGKEDFYYDYSERFIKMEMVEFFDYITKGLSFDVNHVGDHINYWTYDKLKRSLANAGFRIIIKSRYASSISPYMKSKAFFDLTEPQMSLYVDAVK